MASGGTYRINNTEFPAPEDTQWSEQEIAGGLNGIPINTGYKLHTWNFVNMEPCDYENLAAFFDTQQSGNAQLSKIETDVYNANLAGNTFSAMFKARHCKSTTPSTSASLSGCGWRNTLWR